MKLVTVKTAADIPLAGITATLVKEDGSIKECHLRDAEGHLVVFKTESYSFKALVQQEHERCDRYKVTGNFLGIAQINEYFESEYDADAKLREYERKANGDCGLKVERVCVWVNDDGDVLKEIA